MDTEPTVPLISPDTASGATALAEGLKLGAAITPDRTAFHEHYGVRSEVEHRLAKAARGEITWRMIMGLASLEEHLDGLKQLHEHGVQTGVVIDTGLIIPNWVTGLPPDLRAKAPKGTSFVLDGYEAHRAIAQAAPIMPAFNDWHIGSPYASRNTLDAVRAGGTYHGVLSQYTWTLPYVDDEVALVVDNVRAIGIVAAHRANDMVVDSYLDDGPPSRFVDLASFVGYALCERYVVEQLCGARYSAAFGQLESNIPDKIALWLALDASLKSDHPSVSYVYGNTLDASEVTIAGNFAITSAEVIAFTLAERRYRTGTTILPNPATEKIRVPTVREIMDVHEVAQTAAARSVDFERLISWDEIERTRDILIAGGKAFFQNALAGLRSAGVDITDPVHVLLALRRLDAAEMERRFHPGPRHPAAPDVVVPLVPAEFIRRTGGLVDAEIDAVHHAGLSTAGRGRRFLVASADTHSYALGVIVSTLRQLGADVVDAGVDSNPEDLVRLAAENGWPDIAVSAHNGQCLAFAAHLRSLLGERDIRVYMGGKLNTLRGEQGEPVDATNDLLHLGIIPCERPLDMLTS